MVAVENWDHLAVLLCLAAPPDSRSICLTAEPILTTITVFVKLILTFNNPLQDFLSIEYSELIYQSLLV